MSDSTPARYGDWIIDEPMNGGAQALVYHVHREEDSDPYVIKVLKPWTEESKQTSERDQRGRFIEEVSSLQRLRLIKCPRVVRVVDSNIDVSTEEPLWYVMPFYEGGAMRSTTKKGEPGRFAETYTGAVGRVLSIGADLAETVKVMQSGSTQVIHRDIHTQNIFFESSGGRPILGDFGLAAMGKNPRERGTALKEEFGPWRWRPPEMRSGSDNKRHLASDVYMIGGVIYESLSGGSSVAETQDLSGSFNHEKSDYNLENYSPDPRISLITTMLRRCFARDPDARYSASEMQRACSAILQWKPSSPPPDLGERQERIRKAESSAQHKSPLMWHQKQSAELHQIMNSIRAEILNDRNDIAENTENFKFSSILHVMGYSAVARKAFEKFTGKPISDQVVACLVFELSFRPEPLVNLHSSTLIWRDEKHEYVASVNDEAELEILRKSYCGDPKNSILIRQTTSQEIDRLQEMALQAVEGSN